MASWPRSEEPQAEQPQPL